MGITHFKGLPIKFAIITGGAAGAHTVTGIAVGDQLLSVIHLIGSGTALTGGEDLTSEFTITAADTIDNTGGTASTNGKLIVIYNDQDA